MGGGALTEARASKTTLHSKQEVVDQPCRENFPVTSHQYKETDEGKDRKERKKERTAVYTVTVRADITVMMFLGFYIVYHCRNCHANKKYP